MLPIAGALGVDATFQMEGRLPQRPLSPLWEEMERMGCTLTRPTANTIRCTGKLKPGAYSIDGGVSSQYITGLLYALCLMDRISTLDITGTVQSTPYIDLTRNVLTLFGGHFGGKGFHTPGYVTWAEEYNRDFYDLLTADRDKALRILSVDRGGKKPRKDIAKWSEVPDFVAYLYDDLYTENFDQLPENVTPADAAAILEAYIDVYDENDDQSEWFNKVKSLCEPLGYTPNVKEWKQDPTAFKGHVGHLSTVIRVAIK